MGLSAEDEKVCREAFLLYESESGKVPAFEFGNIMRIGGANPSEEDIEKIVGTKTHLTWDEYRNAMGSQKLHEDTSAVAASAFEIFDATGKGVIDVAELRGVMGNLGERFSHEEIGKLMLMAEIDADNTMKISELTTFLKDNK